MLIFNFQYIFIVLWVFLHIASWYSFMHETFSLISQEFVSSFLLLFVSASSRLLMFFSLVFNSLVLGTFFKGLPTLGYLFLLTVKNGCTDTVFSHASGNHPKTTKRTGNIENNNFKILNFFVKFAADSKIFSKAAQNSWLCTETP